MNDRQTDRRTDRQTVVALCVELRPHNNINIDSV